MFGVSNYYQIARENEEVFRNILRDLRNKRAERPRGIYVPKNLETEIALDEIFKKYSQGNRYGIFTITDFSRPKKNKATIAFEDIASLSGGGAELEYLVKGDNSVQYKRSLYIVVS
ncbi:MAG: hypothetical protein ABIH63_00540 [archaeon]